MRIGWRVLLCAGVMASMLTTAGATGAQAAGAGHPASLGWRLALNVRQTRFGLLHTVTAISAQNVWAGGCGQASASLPGPKPVWVPTRPVIAHYRYGAWRPSRLPATLRGCIDFIDASSAANVWAFGESLNRRFQLSVFALMLKNGRWVVARWWGPGTTKSVREVGAAVLSRKNVWVFWQDAVVEHFDGSSWHRSKIALPFADPGLEAVSVDSGGGLWVLTNQLYVMRLRVTAGRYSWQAELLPGVKPNDLASIYAQAPGSVWVTGGGQHFVHGHWVWVPLLEHRYGGAWHHLTARAAVTLASAASDGSGGLWLATDYGNPGHPLVHYAGGRLIPIRLAAGVGKSVVVTALASIPGSRSAWGVGYLSRQAVDLGGVLLKYGR